MQQRRINEKEVEYCLENYDTVYRDRGKIVFRANLLERRRIKVVTLIENDITKIITVADLANEDKHD